MPDHFWKLLMHTTDAWLIQHYPTHLIDVWRCRGGVRYLLRPVLPQDHRLLGDMVRALSPQSRYRRFHGAIRELSDDTLSSLTRVDHRSHLALVVTTVESDREVIVADARCCVDGAGDAAEFAVVVDDARQRRGVGSRLLDALGRAAARTGLRWLHGSVLDSNGPMLSMMDRCGFSRTPDREDDRLVRVERRIGIGGLDGESVDSRCTARIAVA